MRIALSAALLLAFALTAGCGSGGTTITAGGNAISTAAIDRAIGELKPRAAFDLVCPAEELEFVPIRKEGYYAFEMGVIGCGHRAIYYRIWTSGYVWILNSSGPVGQPF